MVEGSFSFWICSDQSNLLSSDEPRYSTVPAKGRYLFVVREDRRRLATLLVGIPCRFEPTNRNRM